MRRRSRSRRRAQPSFRTRSPSCSATPWNRRPACPGTRLIVGRRRPLVHHRREPRVAARPCGSDVERGPRGRRLRVAGGAMKRRGRGRADPRATRGVRMTDLRRISTPNVQRQTIRTPAGDWFVEARDGGEGTGKQPPNQPVGPGTFFAGQRIERLEAEVAGRVRFAVAPAEYPRRGAGTGTSPIHPQPRPPLPRLAGSPRPPPPRRLPRALHAAPPRPAIRLGPDVPPTGRSSGLRDQDPPTGAPAAPHRPASRPLRLTVAFSAQPAASLARLLRRAPPAGILEPQGIPGL